MATIFIVSICFVLPGIIFFVLQRKQSVIVPFLVGALVFFISQMVLRIPLLGLLSQQLSFQLWILNTIPYFLFLAITAGLFEEIGRWIGFHCIKKHWSLYDALAFGLGHGAIEAILLTGIPVLQTSGLMFQDVFAGGIERISAMMIHIAFTLLVWKGVKHKRVCYLLYAILGHAVFDFIAVMLMQLHFSIFFIELMLFIFAISMLGICYKTIIRKERT